MAEMSKEEWAEKDKRITKQACFKAAATIAGGVGCGDINTVIENAQKLLEWVYNETVDVKTDVVSDIVHPTPTQIQKKALEEIEKETGWTASQVWTRFKAFPSTQEHINKCVAKIKEV